MGLPDIDSFAILGGELVNFHPVEDATTDLDAECDNATRCNVAMMTHMTPRAWVRFTGHATTPVLVSHDSLWGSISGVAPTIARTGTGIVTLTYTATQTDERNVSHTLNLRAAIGNSRGGTTKYDIHAAPTSANVITCHIWNSAGSLNDAAGVDFDVIIF